MNSYQTPRFSMFPPVVKNLLIANFIFFFATYVVQSTYNFDLTNVLGLHFFESHNFKIYQLITYLFMHANIMHIGFNMFALWMFGQVIENYWGSRRFIIFYTICGIGAGLTQELTQYIYFHHLQQVIEVFNSSPSMAGYNDIVAKYFDFKSGYAAPTNTQEASGILAGLYKFAADNSNTIGASGAIFGVLLAFGMLFPNTPLYIMFIPIPVKAKYVVIGYGLIEQFSGVANRSGDNVAHYAHLGGMLFGFVMIMYWKKKQRLY